MQVTIDPRAFQHWDGGWQTEPGKFDLEARAAAAARDGDGSRSTS